MPHGYASIFRNPQLLPHWHIIPYCQFDRLVLNIKPRALRSGVVPALATIHEINEVYNSDFALLGPDTATAADVFGFPKAFYLLARAALPGFRKDAITLVLEYSGRTYRACSFAHLPLHYLFVLFGSVLDVTPTCIDAAKSPQILSVNSLPTFAYTCIRLVPADTAPSDALTPSSRSIFAAFIARAAKTATEATKAVVNSVATLFAT